MKVLIYSHMFPPAIGGMQYSNLEIARGLQALGHCIQVIACDSRNAQEYISHLAFPVRLLPKWPSLNMYSLVGKSLLNWIFSPFYYLTVKKEIDHFKPDIILVADETSNCFWGCWANWIEVPYISYCSVPFISMKGKKGKRGFLYDLKLQINQIKIEFFEKFIRNSYDQSKLIISVSESTKTEVINNYQQFSNKIQIIPRSIDNMYFENQINIEELTKIENKYNINNDHFILASVTNLNSDKGIDDVINAIHRLDNSQRNSLRYFVIGDGKAYKALKNQSISLGLDQNIIFVGRVDHEETIHYYDICDLFILPSRRGKAESFGRVFVEAAARYKPSLGVRDGGMVDIIENGKMGFLVEAGNIKKIKGKIEWSMKNKGKLREMGKKARESVETKYKSMTIALQFESHLRRIVNSDQNQI